MATMFPLSCHARTIRILCSGVTRAYTRIFSTNSLSSSSLIPSIWTPSQAWEISSRIPILFAIAAAVTLWSPVIITGQIPARLQSETAAALSVRGGSIIASNPRKTSPCSSSVEIFFSTGKWRYPIPRTRKPDSEYCSLTLQMFSTSTSVTGKIFPPFWI